MLVLVWLATALAYGCFSALCAMACGLAGSLRPRSGLFTPFLVGLSIAPAVALAYGALFRFLPVWHWVIGFAVVAAGCLAKGTLYSKYASDTVERPYLFSAICEGCALVVAVLSDVVTSDGEIMVGAGELIGVVLLACGLGWLARMGLKYAVGIDSDGPGMGPCHCAACVVAAAVFMSAFIGTNVWMADGARVCGWAGGYASMPRTDPFQTYPESGDEIHLACLASGLVDGFSFKDSDVPCLAEPCDFRGTPGLVTLSDVCSDGFGTAAGGVVKRGSVSTLDVYGSPSYEWYQVDLAQLDLLYDREAFRWEHSTEMLPYTGTCDYLHAEGRPVTFWEYPGARTYLSQTVVGPYDSTEDRVEGMWQDEDGFWWGVLDSGEWVCLTDPGRMRVRERDLSHLEDMFGHVFVPGDEEFDDNHDTMTHYLPVSDGIRVRMSPLWNLNGPCMAWWHYLVFLVVIGAFCFFMVRYLAKLWDEWDVGPAGTSDGEGGSGSPDGDGSGGIDVRRDKAFAAMYIAVVIAVVLGLLTIARWKTSDRLIQGMDKPVVYLYPEERTEVSVGLDLDGELTCAYPLYGDGWHVVADPDGTLTDDGGQAYNYLYWEGLVSTEFDFSEGFCVPGRDTAAFLEEALPKLGLDRREANEFIVYWLPLMESNVYNLISFESDAYTDHARLDITPEPDTIIRVFMAWKPVDGPVDIPEQELDAPAREGFTVVEWGGTEVK